MCLLSAEIVINYILRPTLVEVQLYVYFITMRGPFIRIAIDARESHFLRSYSVVKNKGLRELRAYAV
jgi:hypothetical protein